MAGEAYSNIKKEFIFEATEAGFTEEQALFMWRYLYLLYIGG